MTNEALPPLCSSALGAILLLVGAGVLPWMETVLLLTAIALLHGVVPGLRQRPNLAAAVSRESGPPPMR